MKNLRPLFAICLIATFIMSGCSEDDGGEMDETTFTGEAFLGTYTMAETCNESRNYDITIAQSSSGDNALEIAGLYDLSASISGTIEAIVVSPEEFSISGQKTNGFEFNGNGTINGNVLYIDFRVADVTDEDLFVDCTATGSKK